MIKVGSRKNREKQLLHQTTFSFPKFRHTNFIKRVCKNGQNRDLTLKINLEKQPNYLVNSRKSLKGTKNIKYVVGSRQMPILTSDHNIEFSLINFIIPFGSNHFFLNLSLIHI